MAGEEFEYDSQFWPDYQIISNMKDLPSDIFYIQIRYREVRQRKNPCPEESMDDEPFLEEPMGPLVVKSFWASKTSMLVDNGAGVQQLYEDLASLGVPRYYIVMTIDEISSYARDMIAQPHNFGREVLPIVLCVKALKTESMYETIL